LYRITDAVEKGICVIFSAGNGHPMDTAREKTQNNTKENNTKGRS
jgi:hypothetical protein